MTLEETERERMAEEENIRTKKDAAGNTWKKVYFGGGTHFRNWLSQCQELCGEDNVETEEVDAGGLKCFEESGEKLFRIWIKE